MTMKTSIKMYLTIFLMTTCIYMVLYQYHLSRAEILTSQDNEIKVVTNHQQKKQDEIRTTITTRSKTTSTKITTTTTTSTRTHGIRSIDNNNNYVDQHNSKFALEKSPGSTATYYSTMLNTVLPPLYVITPTYRRPEQLAELTRLGYTLKHLSNLLWLVIEDAEFPSQLVTKTLKHIGVSFEHLTAPMPAKYRSSKAIPRGVSNRNRGLQWLRANATDGVFYFADDDNTYDVSIFEQMRYTKKVSMWPVGLVTKLGVSSPIVRSGKLVGFYDGWIGGRKYPVDMAGFAVSVKFLLERPKAEMPYKAGYEEDGFLKSLAPLNNSDIELLANLCTEILTWHTQTKKNEVAVKLNMTKYGDTNLVKLTKMLVGK